jgi:hypothetical protein
VLVREEEGRGRVGRGTFEAEARSCCISSRSASSACPRAASHPARVHSHVQRDKLSRAEGELSQVEGTLSQLEGGKLSHFRGGALPRVEGVEGRAAADLLLGADDGAQLRHRRPDPRARLLAAIPPVRASGPY